GTRSRPLPGGRGTCPSCGATTIAKCGEINAWHWAHEARDCDPWSEGETEWHLSWKGLFGDEQCEVSMPPHRADVVGKHGCVLELQHSSIPAADIRKREAFYKRMIWLFDASGFAENMIFRKRDGYFSFRWKHPRKSLWECRQPLYLDFGPDWQKLRECDMTAFAISTDNDEW